MATVIDSLVVELGIDSRKLEEGSRAALVSVDEFKRRLSNVTDEVKGGVEKTTNAFFALRGGIFGVVAALGLGLGAAAAFVEKIMHLDAQTSRLARSIGVQTRELSIWQGVLKQVGGSAEDANSTFESLADTLADIRLGISMPSGPFAFMMGRMGLNMRTATPEQVMEKVPEFVQQQRAAGMDELRIRGLLRQMGLSGATLFAAMHGDFAGLRKGAEGVGPLTTEQGQAAENLQRRQSIVEFALDRLASKSLRMLNSVVDGIIAGLERLKNELLGLGGGTPAAAATPTTGAPGAATRPSTRLPWGGGPLLGDVTGLGGRRLPASSSGAPHEDGTGAAVRRAYDKLQHSSDPGIAHGMEQRGMLGTKGFRSRFPVPEKQSSLGGARTTVVNVAALNVTSNRADPRQVAEAAATALNRRVVMAVSQESALT